MASSRLHNVLLGIFCTVLAVYGGIVIFIVFRKLNPRESGIALEARVAKAKALFAQQSTVPLIISYPASYDHTRTSAVRVAMGELIDKFLGEVDKKNELGAHRESLIDVLVIMERYSLVLENYMAQADVFRSTTAVKFLETITSILMGYFDLAYFPAAELFLLFPHAITLDCDNVRVDGGFKNIDAFIHLYALLLQNNELTEIPDLRVMKSLKVVNLAGNRLSGVISLPDIFPPALYNLSLRSNSNITKLEGLESMLALKKLEVERAILVEMSLSDFEKLANVNPNLAISWPDRNQVSTTAQVRDLLLKKQKNEMID